MDKVKDLFHRSRDGFNRLLGSATSSQHAKSDVNHKKGVSETDSKVATSGKSKLTTDQESHGETGSFTESHPLSELSADKKLLNFHISSSSPTGSDDEPGVGFDDASNVSDSLQQVFLATLELDAWAKGHGQKDGKITTSEKLQPVLDLILPEFIETEFSITCPYIGSRKNVASQVAQAMAQFYSNYLRHDGGLSIEEMRERPKLPDPELANRFQHNLESKLKLILMGEPNLRLFMWGFNDPINVCLKELSLSSKFFPSQLCTSIFLKLGMITISIHRSALQESDEIL